MKPRNEELRAEIHRIAVLQLQIPRTKLTAAKYGSTPQSIRFMLMQERNRLRKLTIVRIQSDKT